MKRRTPELRNPPDDLHETALDLCEVPSRLLRCSRYESNESYFGTHAVNRFDDPARDKKSRYGTCYFGLDIRTAIAETVLHDLVPANGCFYLAVEELSERWIHEFCTDGLELVNFVGPSLLRLGGDGSISSGLDIKSLKRGRRSFMLIRRRWTGFAMFRAS